MFNPQEGFHSYYVYILTNKYRSTFYIGVTNNLKLRLQQHKDNLGNGNKTLLQNTV
ncbi:GIY-YIG nuclease family protein [Flavobacterium sp. LC2016-12]|uniref:GIY-YIG nuclease family protein n=1 Tax=Flavobacterium sp. LC2016-12 TaxID=2783794 RepID=UPI00351B4F75